MSLLYKFASSNLSGYPLAWFTGHSSERWRLGTHPPCMVLWDRPLDGHTRILSQLDSANPERMVGSSMIRGWQTASFSLQHRLQGSPLEPPQLWKMLGLQQLMSSWCQVSENPLLLYELRLGKRILWIRCKFLNFKCFRMWITSVVLNACIHEHI